MANIPSDRIAPAPQHPVLHPPEPVRRASAPVAAKPLNRPQVEPPPRAGKPISAMSVQLLPPLAARSASRSPAFPAFDEVLTAAQDYKSGATVSMVAARAVDARISALCRELKSQPVGSAFLHSALQRSAQLCADRAITPRHFTRIMTALAQAADRGNMRPATAAGFVRTLAALPGTSTSPEIQSLALKSLAGALKSGAARNVAASALVDMLAGRPPAPAKKMFDEFLGQLLPLPHARPDAAPTIKASLDGVGELPRIRSDAKLLANELAHQPPEAIVAYLRAQSADTPEAERPRLIHLARELGRELEQTGHGPDAKAMKKASAKASPQLRQLLAAVSDGAAAVAAERMAEPNREAIKQFVREGRFDAAFQMIARVVDTDDVEFARELLELTLSGRSSQGLARKRQPEPLARLNAFHNWIQKEKAQSAQRHPPPGHRFPNQKAQEQALKEKLEAEARFVRLEALHQAAEARLGQQMNPDQLY